MLHRLSDGACHSLYIAGDRVGYVQQIGVVVEAFDRRGNGLGRFGEAEAAVKAVISAAGTARFTHRARSVAE
jgi:hypothetical protein